MDCPLYALSAMFHSFHMHSIAICPAAIHSYDDDPNLNETSGTGLVLRNLASRPLIVGLLWQLYMNPQKSFRRIQF
eukprot:4974700-Pleurochrysis_carterae.AAC.1